MAYGSLWGSDALRLLQRTPDGIHASMKLEADARIAFPRELVFSTYRDRLPQLVPFLPDVKSIVVQERTDAPDGTDGSTVLEYCWDGEIRFYSTTRTEKSSVQS